MDPEEGNRLKCRGQKRTNVFAGELNGDGLGGRRNPVAQKTPQQISFRNLGPRVSSQVKPKVNFLQLLPANWTRDSISSGRGGRLGSGAFGQLEVKAILKKVFRLDWRREMSILAFSEQAYHRGAGWGLKGANRSRIEDPCT